MQINRNNFEAFFLDYWEGNLSDKDKEALTHFLEFNPDLQEAFYDYLDVKDFSLIANETVVYEGKNHLKKEVVKTFGNINNDNYETFVIASLEGDLSKKEQNDFHGFISLNPNIRKVFTDYKKVFLKPPKNLVFQGKEQLKRKTIFINQRRLTRWLGAAAAILIVGITMFYIFLSDQPVDVSNQVAQTKEPVINEKENVISSEGNVAEAQKNNPNLVTESDTKMLRPTEKSSDNTKTDLAEIAKIDHSQTKIIEQTNRSGDFVKHGSEKVCPLTAIAIVNSFCDKITPLGNIENREECSLVFDDLLLRDAIKANSEKTQSKKSAIERVFANLGNKIVSSNNSDNVNHSLVSQIATKGKETVTGFSSILPVYRTSENDGKKETYLAFSESFSVYRSKTIDEIQPEKIPNKH